SADSGASCRDVQRQRTLQGTARGRQRPETLRAAVAMGVTTHAGMIASVSVQTLFEDHKAKHRLEWIAGRSGAERLVQSDEEHKVGASLIGHLNFIHPYVVQVLGNPELHYLRRLAKNSRADAIRQLLSD